MLCCNQAIIYGIAVFEFGGLINILLWCITKTLLGG